MRPLNGSLLAVRADASASIGAGHVMRCLALAEAWRDTVDAGEAVFIMASCAPALQARLLAEGVRIEWIDAEPGSVDDAERATALLGRLGACAVVLDGYQFTDEYEEEIGRANIAVLAWDDDGHAGHVNADLVLNQNLSAHPGLYAAARRRGRELLLGGGYICLRRAFRLARDGGAKAPSPEADNVLVLAGGGDADAYLTMVFAALQEVGVVWSRVNVLLGGAAEQNRDRAEELSEQGFHVAFSVANPETYMLRADVAISAAGSTIWELMTLGVPTCSVPVADNQRANAELLDDRELVPMLAGSPAELTEAGLRKLRAVLDDPGRRAQMARSGRETVDGRGVFRVLDAIRGSVHSRGQVGPADRTSS